MKKILLTGAFALAMIFGLSDKANAQYFSYSVSTFPTYGYAYPAYPVYPAYPGGVSINYYSGGRGYGYDRWNRHHRYDHRRHDHRYDRRDHRGGHYRR